MSWYPQDYDPDWPYEWLATNFKLDLSSTALLVIDLQASSMCREPDTELRTKYPSVAAYCPRRGLHLLHSLPWWR